MRLAYITYSIIVVISSVIIGAARDDDSDGWHRSTGHTRAVGGGWIGGGWSVGGHK